MNTTAMQNEMAKQTALNRWIATKNALAKEKCLSLVISDWWDAMAQNKDDVRRPTDPINTI